MELGNDYDWYGCFIIVSENGVGLLMTVKIHDGHKCCKIRYMMNIKAL